MCVCVPESVRRCEQCVIRSERANAKIMYINGSMRFARERVERVERVRAPAYGVYDDDASKYDPARVRYVLRHVISRVSRVEISVHARTPHLNMKVLLTATPQMRSIKYTRALECRENVHNDATMLRRA